MHEMRRRVPTPHRRSAHLLASGAVLGTLLVWSVAVTPALRAAPATVPSKGACYPKLTPTYDVLASASPDLGGADPTVLVTVGTTVQLTGISDKYIVLADCSEQDTPVPFTWSLSLQPTGGAGTSLSKTASLQNGTTLTPTFVASQPGTYVAQIHAAGRLGTVHVESISRGLSWTSIGPNGSIDSQGNGYTSVGRVNAIAFDPKAPSTLYAASALGGVWKSLDRGGDWLPVTDHKGLPTLAFGALAIASDGTIYAGTGDLHHNDDGLWQDGAGIWRSHDGGLTWQSAGTALNEACPAGSVPFVGTASRIVVNPQNPAVIFVAARPSTGSSLNASGPGGSGGLFRSTDGGDCWQTIGAFTDVTDLALISSNPTTLYVGALQPTTGIFKTTDALDATPLFTQQGLPVTKAYTSIVLASAPSNSSDIYAALSVTVSTDFVRSTNSGASWQLEGQPAPLQCGPPDEAQCDYDSALAISPTNPNRIFYGENAAWQSTDGMQSWTSIGYGHSDHHELAFAPDDPNTLYAANDGGVFRLAIPTDITHPQPTQAWQPRNLDLSIAQAPEVAADPNNPQGAALGAWDNGSERRLAGRTWDEFRGGDGFNAAIDAAAGPQTIYFNWNAGNGNEFGRFPGGADLGAALNYVSNPYRPGELFGIGARNLPGLYVAENANTAATADWRCADVAPAGGAAAWSVEFAADGSYFEGLTDGSLYHFTLPDAQTIQNTQALSTCAANATAAQSVVQILAPSSSGPPRLAADPFDAQSIYVMRPGDMGATRVMKLTHTTGNTWSVALLAGTVADPTALPVTVNSNTLWSIGADPSADGVVYIGTTHGVWEGEPLSSGGYGWSFNLDVPDTWIMGFAPQRNANGYGGVLLLTTYGRGVWERFKSNVPCHVSCIPLGAQSPYCLTCLSGAQDAGTSGQSAIPDDEAWLSIPYIYRGGAGPQAVLHVTPIVAGADAGDFQSVDQIVDIGEGTRDVRIRYAAATAPLGLHSDGFLIELLPIGGGAPLVRSTLLYAHWWVRPEARLLTVSAQAIDPGPWPLQVPITLAVGNGPASRVTTPLTMPVPSNATVIIAAPSHFTNDTKPLSLANWSASGKLLGSQSSIRFAAATDVALVARYGEADVAVPPANPPDVHRAVQWPILLLTVGVAVAVLGLVIGIVWMRRRRMHRAGTQTP